MNDVVRTLLTTLETSTLDQQENVLLTLSFLLEYSNSKIQNEAQRVYYKNYLTDELMDNPLDTADQADLVNTLLMYINNTHPENVQSFIITIGKARPEIAIAPVLSLMETIAEAADETTIRQLITTLTNQLDRDKDWKPVSAIVAQLLQKDPRPFLKDIVGSAYITLNDAAKYAITAIDRYFEDAKA